MPDMTPDQALGAIRTKFDQALGRVAVTPIRALEPREVIAGATECYAAMIRLPSRPVSGGTRLRIALESYYAIHYASDGANTQPIQDAIKLAWALQDAQAPNATLFNTAIDQDVLIKLPDGGEAGPIEVFFNPVVRGGGVVTLAVNFIIEMSAPRPV